MPVRDHRERLVSLREAARMLGVHHATLARAVKRGELKAAMTTPGGWNRFRRSDVERLAGSSPAKIVRSTIDGDEQSTGAPNDVEHTLAALPEIARRVIGADFAAITVLNAEGGVMQMYYSGLSEQQAESIGDPPRGVGVLGQLGQAGGVLRLAHISQHPKSSGFPANHPPMESLIGINIGVEGGLRANLYLANGPGRGGFSDQDEDRLVALARYGRLGLENARLLEVEAQFRRQAESAGRHLEEVIRGSAAGVIILNVPNRSVAFASAEARRITGHQLNSGTSRDDYLEHVHYFTPAGAPVNREDLPFERVLKTSRRIEPIEMVIERADRVRIPVLVSASPVKDENGSPASVMLVFQDIAKIKELDQVKNEFLSMITHDLRTPLATIKGVSNMVMDLVPSDSDLKLHLSELADEVDYMTELVGNLLDMSRIEAGASRQEYETSHMADIVQDALIRQRRSRVAVGRDFSVSVPLDLPPVYVDPTQIGRVLDNLLNNALKYSDGLITLSATANGPSTQILIEISDEGEGIPAHLLEGIFDKFMRIRRGLRHGREGSGLGLAICKAIVEAHGGKIGVRSIEREGSTFWFTLPVDQAGAPAGT